MTAWRKSSHSSYNGNCVEVAGVDAAGWRKSGYCRANDACVEVAGADVTALARAWVNDHIRPYAYDFLTFYDWKAIAANAFAAGFGAGLSARQEPVIGYRIGDEVYDPADVWIIRRAEPSPDTENAAPAAERSSEGLTPG